MAEHSASLDVVSTSSIRSVREAGEGGASADRGSAELPLIAYAVHNTAMRIEPASVDRKWMNETMAGFANRCLPLRIANQSGWVILNDCKFQVLWAGGPTQSDLAIRPYCRGDHDEPPMRIGSHFGHGIVTWTIPFLFRTPPGYNLYVRGPSNYCKDGICPLDAIVETDWAVATFTMNWKVTRPGVPIMFDEGEPICMVFPVRRGELENFTPEIRDIAENPDLQFRYGQWAEGRARFNHELELGSRDLWQKDYYAGREPSGRSFTAHQTKLILNSFKPPTHDSR
jgi:hypothetical protein